MPMRGFLKRHGAIRAGNGSQKGATFVPLIAQGDFGPSGFVAEVIKRCEARAVVKDPILDGCDRGREVNFLEPLATVESRKRESCNGVGDSDSCQACAVIEDSGPEARERGRERDCLEAGAVFKGVYIDFC